MPTARQASQQWVVAAILTPLLVTNGCAVPVAPSPERLAADRSVVFGRALAVITGSRTRAYQPAIGFLEVEQLSTGERFQARVAGDDDVFVLVLPPGRYEVTRVQIREGPFMSLAYLSVRFEATSNSLTYLGTWRFGVDSPRYGRMVVVSVIASDEDEATAERQVARRYPDLGDRVLTAQLPAPAVTETRLYEVMSYPPDIPYFRRHNW